VRKIVGEIDLFGLGETYLLDSKLRAIAIKLDAP